MTEIADAASPSASAECRNLVKGYGDTHERGSANYAAIIAVLDRVATLPQPAPGATR